MAARHSTMGHPSIGFGNGGTFRMGQHGRGMAGFVDATNCSMLT